MNEEEHANTLADLREQQRVLVERENIPFVTNVMDVAATFVGLLENANLSDETKTKFAESTNLTLMV